MKKSILGLVVGFGIGSLCCSIGIPCPAPISLIGVGVLICMTLGYVTADSYLNRLGR